MKQDYSNEYTDGYKNAIDEILKLTAGSNVFYTPETNEELQKMIKQFQENGTMTVMFALNFLSQEIEKLKTAIDKD